MAGSLEKRGENQWRLAVYVGRDKDGKQIKRRKTFNGTEREARKELARFVTEVEKGQTLGATKYTLEEFIALWLRDYAEKNLAPKTLARYKEMLRTRIVPPLGHMKIEKIRPVHILELHNMLQEDGIRTDGKPGGLAERTILHHHRLLSTVLNHAVQWQVIADNPAARVKAPKVKKTRADCYDETQTAALLEALDKEPEDNFKFKVLIVLAIASGLRRGELMGLEWQDVDFSEATLHVRQTSQYIPGVGVITKAPKNETSERLVSVPSSVMTLLRRYKAYQNQQRLIVGDKWQDSERLFTAWDGQAMHPDTISNWFPEFLKRHDLPHLPFHGLRHTAATLLIGQGVHAKTISSRLGHSTISTTMDIYSHHLKSADKSAAEKLDNLFSKDSALVKG